MVAHKILVTYQSSKLYFPFLDLTWGWAWIRNLDSGRSIKIRKEINIYFIKIGGNLFGSTDSFMLSSAAITMKICPFEVSEGPQG